MRAVRLSPNAVDVLAETAAWYRAGRPGLESEVLTEFEQIVLLIEGSAAAFPRLHDLPPDLVMRRALLPRFPPAVTSPWLT